VRTATHPAFPHPNILFCRAGDPAVLESRPRGRLDQAAVTWAVSLGLPSPDPEEWQADVRRARTRMRDTQLLIVSVAGTPGPAGEGLAEDYARCARMAADAGADVVEVHLSCPSTAAEHPQLVFEDQALSARIIHTVRRALGSHPMIAKFGPSASPRGLHELATRLAPWVNGFALVSGLQRRVVKPDGGPAFAGPGRELACVVGAAIHDYCRMQVDELIAWRKAGAWERVILAVGGITSVGRIREILADGADAALVATAALADPLIGARFRLAR
jgi:dihydroorotate dehydrogenase